MITVLVLAILALVGVLVCVLLIAFEWARSKKANEVNVIGRSTQQGWMSTSKDSAIVDHRKRVR
jgi:hypothetical protein